MISGAPFQLLWVQVGARMCAYGCTRAHARMRTHVHPHTRGHRHAPAHRAVQCRKRPHTLAHAPGSPASPAQVLAARPALPPPQEHPEGGDAAFSRDRPPGREAEPALWERVRRPWHCAATDRPPMWAPGWRRPTAAGGTFPFCCCGVSGTPGRGEAWWRGAARRPEAFRPSGRGAERLSCGCGAASALEQHLARRAARCSTVRALPPALS